jgi:chorismate mutase
MIETHINPDVALSDAKQQLTPDSLSILLEKLVMRDCSVTLSVRDQLIDLRDKIAMHDDKLFETLVSRMQISEQIGQLKQQNNITVLQQEHWEHLLKSRLEANDSTQLSEQFIRSIMDAVHQESIRHQMKIMNTGFDWEK